MFKSTDIWTLIVPHLSLHDLGSLRSSSKSLYLLLDQDKVLRSFFREVFDLNFADKIFYSDVPKFFTLLTSSKSDFDAALSKSFRWKPSSKLYSQRLATILKYTNISRKNLKEYINVKEGDTDERIYKLLEYPKFKFFIDNPIHLRLNYFMNFKLFDDIATFWSILESHTMLNKNQESKIKYICTWLRDNTESFFKQTAEYRRKLYTLLETRPNLINVWHIVARDVDLFDPIFVYQNHFKFGFSCESIVKYILLKNISCERLIAEIPSIFENYVFMQALFSNWNFDIIKLLKEEGFPVLQHLEQFEKETCRHDLCNIILDKILV